MTDNNIAALEVAKKLGSDEIRERLAGLHTYGAKAAHQEFSEAKVVVGALDNADTDGALAALAELNPAGIAAGLMASMKLTGAGKAIVILPAGTEGGALISAATEAGIDISLETAEMTDVRAHRADAVFHLATLCAMADMLTGKEPSAVVAVDGKLTEYPFGTQISKIVDMNGKKAVLINHTFFAKEKAEETVCRTMPLGSGVIRTLGEDECIVRAALAETNRLRAKSCGKCTFCREGSYQLYSILSDTVNARGKAQDIALAEELGEAMALSGTCTLGELSSAPFLSALHSFREEVEAHIKKKVCPAGECTAFLKIYIDPEKCQGCGDCIDACPADCIEGKDGFISMIDEFGCTKCKKCIDACPEGAVMTAAGRLPALPERLTRVGRFRARR